MWWVWTSNGKRWLRQQERNFRTAFMNRRGSSRPITNKGLPSQICLRPSETVAPLPTGVQLTSYNKSLVPPTGVDLSKILGGKTKILGKVAKSDKCMRVSQLLGARTRTAPQSLCLWFRLRWRFYSAHKPGLSQRLKFSFAHNRCLIYLLLKCNA